jgi:hypothetical protein
MGEGERRLWNPVEEPVHEQDEERKNRALSPHSNFLVARLWDSGDQHFGAKSLSPSAQNDAAD